MSNNNLGAERKAPKDSIVNTDGFHIENSTIYYKENYKMSNKALVPEAKEALEKFKMEAANEVGVNLKQGYNGELTSKQAGSIGGQMVKKMVESYENSIKTNK